MTTKTPAAEPRGQVVRLCAGFVRPGAWSFALRFCVVAGLALLAVRHYVVWPPDTVFLMLLLVFAALGQFRAFVRHLAPFVGLFVAYNVIGGLADDLNPQVHYTPMIEADRLLAGGVLPTHWLQQRMWQGTPQWYDFYFYVLYTLHFLLPLLCAILLWKRRAAFYRPFLASFSALSLAAFLTYVIFPAAPPWMAADQGRIGPLRHISLDVWSAMGVSHPALLYDKISPNLVAAVPSLHAAYPLLLLLFLGRSFGWRRVWWVSFYPVSVWVAVVYLGEHYVVDVILGVLYAAVADRVVMRLVAARRRRAQPEQSGEAKQEEGRHSTDDQHPGGQAPERGHPEVQVGV